MKKNVLFILSLATLPIAYAMEFQGEDRDQAICDAAEQGDVSQLKKLLFQSPLREEESDLLLYLPNNQKVVELLIKSGVKGINKKSSCGMTPLIEAASKGKEKVVAALIRAGANVDLADDGQLGLTPLHWAAAYGFFEICKFLLEYNATIDLLSKAGWTALMYAAQKGRLKICRLLIEKGADIHPKSFLGCVEIEGDIPITLASSKGHFKVCELLLKEGADGKVKDREVARALMYAVKNGHFDIVQLLIRFGALINHIDLGFAIEHKQVEIAKLFIEMDVDVNSFLAPPCAHHSNKYTPLLQAVDSNLLEVCQLLIEKGSDVDRANIANRTPLGNAILTSENIDICRLLIESGAEVDTFVGESFKSDYAASPLIWAVKKNMITISILLLDKWADIRIKDTGSVSAIHYASKQGNVQLYKSLLSHAMILPKLDKVGESYKRIREDLFCLKMKERQIGRSLSRDIRYKILLLNERSRNDLIQICIDRIRRGRTIPQGFIPLIMNVITNNTIEELKVLKLSALDHLLDPEQLEVNFGNQIRQNIHDVLWQEKYSRLVPLPPKPKSVKKACVIQ